MFHNHSPLRLSVVAIATITLLSIGNSSSLAHVVTYRGPIHEQVTLAAVNFSPKTAEQIKRAVTANDSGSTHDMSEAHCDNADYLPSKYYGNKVYPRTRKQATENLQACAQFAFTQFKNAVKAADGLVDGSGKPYQDQVRTKECKYDLGTGGQKKCVVLEGLGRWWHVVEDFYAHSNYADKAAPGQSLGFDNVPGLALKAPAPFFNMKEFYAHGNELADLDQFGKMVPDELTTGCFHNESDAQHKQKDNNDCVRHSDHPGVAPRVTHQDDCTDSYCGNGIGLSKDDTWRRRSMVEFASGTTNYDQVIGQVTDEVRQQWGYFKQVLATEYGSMRADAMIKAITNDFS
ncbi:hypothetical protein ACFVHI_20875 [Kitasatospora sp. NPDC127121]|uniref:hypothetical protein n=1 Tax=Kitasatospora sp. NPDC127121 TaxID=3345371 RepID=UPI0036403D44